MQTSFTLYKLSIDSKDIESTKSAKLLGITIDDRFVFQSCNAIKYFRSTSEIYGKIWRSAECKQFY